MNAEHPKNSLDLLRLGAAIMVLYSHQYALLGLAEPAFLGLNSFGGVGVALFFFLSGFLVSASWERDPDIVRFFTRRSLRIFPGLWFVFVLSFFLLGPLLTTLPLDDYFSSTTTWRYLGTAALVSSNVLPGVFADNPMPLVINGSLWSLPVEFLCYGTVAALGLMPRVITMNRDVSLGVALVGVMVAATYGPPIIGVSLWPHLEMVAMFWWGCSTVIV